jgi:membrane associated rhomboid family serine protease
MIPLKDDNPTQTFPFVTIGIITLNCLVYLYQLSLSSEGLQSLLYRYGAIPALLIHPFSADLKIAKIAPALPPILTVFSSMFMHGGMIHLLGNMLYLWVFGNNIEDYLGHVKFMLFYLISGFFAAFFHTAYTLYKLPFIDPMIPMIGASGAIAGVLGAYFLLFPRANVSTLFIFIIFFKIIKVPAVLILGFWFLIQLLNAGSEGGSVAWYAHLGGFLTGLIMVRFFKPARRVYS